jgi:hypothetical protein
MLFTVWSMHPHRATKDLDLLGSGPPDLERLAAVFREVVTLSVDDDGIVFEPGSVRANRLKDDAEYEGVRVTFEGKLGSAKLAVQVDVGFGDSVTPPPLTIALPTLLEFPACKPRLRSGLPPVAHTAPSSRYHGDLAQRTPTPPLRSAGSSERRFAAVRPEALLNQLPPRITRREPVSILA